MPQLLTVPFRLLLLSIGEDCGLLKIADSFMKSCVDLFIPLGFDGRYGLVALTECVCWRHVCGLISLQSSVVVHHPGSAFWYSSAVFLCLYSSHFVVDHILFVDNEAQFTSSFRLEFKEETASIFFCDRPAVRWRRC